MSWRGVGVWAERVAWWRYLLPLAHRLLTYEGRCGLRYARHAAGAHLTVGQRFAGVRRRGQ